MTAIDHSMIPAKAITAIANTGIFGGAMGAIGGWLAGQNLIGWAGVAIGIGGLCISWYHKRELRRYERERIAIAREHLELDKEARNG